MQKSLDWSECQLYAANVHSGGGMTASATTLNAISLLVDSGAVDGGFHPQVVVSPGVYGELLPVAREVLTPVVRGDHPFGAVGRGSRHSIDKRLILFGPEYRRNEGSYQVCGFADGSILPPAGLDDEARRTTPGWRAAAKRSLLRRYDAFVVQTPSAADRLRALVGDKPIRVIPNSLHPTLLDTATWLDFGLPPSAADIRFFYPASGMPHKNHGVIDAAGDLLRRQGVLIDVVTTIAESSSASSSTFRIVENSSYCTNVGRLSTAQLPAVYNACDAVMFPSLLETFSSVVIEAVHFGKPLFAAQRPYVTDIVGDYGYYFNPTDPRQLADQILRYLDGLDPTGKPTGFQPRQLAADYHPLNNAKKYLDLLQ